MSASPFVWKNSLKLSWQPFKKEHEDRLRPFNGFANLGIALADLNSSGNAFGWNRDRVGYAASLTKIAAMYAAFQLQASLKIFPGAGALKTAALQMQLEKEWRPELKNILGAVAAKNDFPQLAKIFVPNDPGFSFNKTFQSNLEGMIGPSHGWNAGYCIQAIGFDYIAAALIHGGFYSVKDSRGLWLSGDFVGGYQPGVDGTPAPGVEKTITDPSQRHQVATAEAVTLFMANLGNNQLINKTASLAMQGLMWNSWAGQPEALGKTNRVYGKVGIQPNNVSYDDCAIVERHCMNYSMTVLFIPGGIQYDLFKELDTIADELFGLSREICEIGHKLATKIKFF